MIKEGDVVRIVPDEYANNPWDSWAGREFIGRVKDKTGVGGTVLCYDEFNSWPSERPTGTVGGDELYVDLDIIYDDICQECGYTKPVYHQRKEKWVCPFHHDQ